MIQIAQYEYGTIRVEIVYHEGKFRGFWYLRDLKGELRRQLEGKLRNLPTSLAAVAPFYLGTYDDPKEAEIGSLLELQAFLSRVSEGIVDDAARANTSQLKFQERLQHASLVLDDYVSSVDDAQHFRKNQLEPLIEKVDKVYIQIKSSEYDYTTIKKVFEDLPREKFNIRVQNCYPLHSMVEDMLI